MLKPLFDSSSLSLLEKVARFGERRQEVLAGNIANIDTPNYKPRDLPVEDFQRALKQAVAQHRQTASPGSTLNLASANQRSIDELFTDDLFRAVEGPQRNITFQDGNNRSIESEVMEMTKNSMMQNFAIELMVSQMNMLQAVISERA